MSSSRTRCRWRRSMRDGVPDARYLLVRGVDERGFAFFTNYESAKSPQLAADPSARRRLRLAAAAPPGAGARHGRAGRRRREPTRTSPAGRGQSQIGAWASPQSQVLADRAELDAVVAAVDGRFAGRRRAPARRTGAGWRLVPVAGRVLAGPPEPPARPRSATGATPVGLGRSSASRPDRAGPEPGPAVVAAAARPSMSASRVGVEARALPVPPERAASRAPAAAARSARPVAPAG